MLPLLVAPLSDMGATGSASMPATMAPGPDSPIGSLSPSSSSVRSAVAARSPPVGDSSSDDGESRYDFSDSHEAYELQDFGGGRAARGDGSVGAPTTRRMSGSTAASFQLYTPDEERAVVRQFDRRLVLFLALCYLLSFLDRSNIGNARIAGMDADLQTRPPRDGWYEWSLTSFYVAYIAFEWMSMLWRIIPAHVYVSLIVLSWGVTASLQAVAVSYPMLVVLRFLLGIGEAGFTGVPFFLSFFYKRNELAYRTAMFVAAAPLATMFASSLAWLILKLGEAVPIAPWRLLFLLEGFPSVLVAVVAWGAVVDSPQTAHYLTPRLRKVARLRLRHEGQTSQGSHGSSSNSNSNNKSNKTRGRALKEALSVLADPKAWLPAVMFFLTNMAYSSLPVFLPTILREMGHSPLESQALSAPPYLMAFLSVLATAHVSDRAARRTPYIVAFSLASAVGYLVLALARPLGIGPMWRYLAVYPAAVGFFNVVVLTIAWSINNQPSEDRRGGGFALLQVVGQCGPLVGTRLYPQRDAPYFESGMWTCAGCMAGAALAALVLRFLLGRHNRRLDAADTGPGAEEAQGLVDPAGDGRKTSAEPFRYML